MKMIIVDLYEISEEFQKENNLLYKKRAKAYVYETGKILDYAITEHHSSVKIGDIIGG